MALKPPGRGGSSSGIGQGIRRRRKNLSESIVKQTYGGAADAVLTDYVFASEVTANDNKTGTVTGSATTSGTITGKKATTGTVAGSATTSGTVVGKEGEPGTITGSATTSGTITGKAGRAGTVAGSATTSGTVTGTAYDPTPPAPSTATGGMSAYRRAQIAEANALAAQQALDAEQAANTRTGSVHGTATTAGTIRGHATRTGRTLSTPGITYRSHVTGTTRRGGTVLARTETRGRITGDAVSMLSHAELRRLRDDAELLLLI